MLVGQDILMWSILSLICGCIPLFLGVNFVNQFSKITKLDYQEKHKLVHNSVYNYIGNSFKNQNSIQKKFEIYKDNQNQNFISRQFFGKKKGKTEEMEIHLHKIFYELLESKNGYLTALNLAMESQVSGKIANEFLIQKAKEFNHQIIVDNDGGMAYKFEYLTQNEIENLTKD